MAFRNRLRFSARVGARILAAAAIASTAASGTARAAERRLELDPKMSAVSFDLSATAHDVRGSFPVARGDIWFDDETGTARGEIVVDAKSGVTGNGSRDRTMRDKVLEAAHFPEVRLVVSGVQGKLASSGRSTLQLRGVLVLHGSEHPLTLAVEATVEGDRLKAESAFEVPFVAWGLEDPSVFVLRVAPVVQVQVVARGRLTAGPGPTGGSGR
jgi:polyisoprenoid-binding protein YceI